jgi:hypothetical protein
MDTRVESFPVNREVLELVSVSIASHNCVLPVRVSEGVVHLLVSQYCDLREEGFFERLRREMGREFTYQFVDDKTLMPAVLFHYMAVRAEIFNCGPETCDRCPRSWADLTATSDRRVRHCQECRRDIKYCETCDEERLARQSGECAAYVDCPRSADTIPF